MTVAMKVIDAALRDDFGFKHVLWVYSGRRGVHCWISDERARRLTNDRRKAIVNYLNVVKVNRALMFIRLAKQEGCIGISTKSKTCQIECVTSITKVSQRDDVRDADVLCL